LTLGTKYPALGGVAAQLNDLAAFLCEKGRWVISGAVVKVVAKIKVSILYWNLNPGRQARLHLFHFIHL
jgi:hypothetical protein